MKPNFKTTAVAILVALGVSACKSNDPEVSKPSTPTNNQAQQQAKAKAEQEAKAKAEREAKAKAEQEAKAKAEQAAKAKAEQEAKAKEEAARKAQEEANKAKAEKEKADAAAKQAAEAKAKAEQEARAKEEAARKAREAEEKAKADKAKAEEIAKAEAARKAKEEEARKAKEAADKAKAEADKKAAEAKAKADAERKAAEDKARLEKERAEAAKRAEAEKASKEKVRIDAELAKMPKNKDGSTEQLTFKFLNDDGIHNDSRDSSNQRDFNSAFKLPETYKTQKFIDLEAAKPLNINVTQITEDEIKKGGKYLGLHQGTLQFEGIDIPDVKNYTEPTARGELPTATEITFDNDKVNYVFINTPYTTYGAIYSSPHKSTIFAKAYKNSSLGKISEYKQGQVKFIDSLAGDVTYKGNVIAVVGTAYSAGLHIDGVYEAPRLDGDVTLNARFENGNGNAEIKGEINSNTIGKIELKPEKFSFGSYVDRGKVSTDKLYRGSYNLSLVGPEANEVLGNVEVLKTLDNGRPVEYQAVFGATKQPR